MKKNLAPLRNRLLTNVRSPVTIQVDGPSAEVDEFYTAFNMQPGSPM